MKTELQSIVNHLLTIRNYAHFYHLNVKGSHFFTLHEQYKQIYEFSDSAADTVAELIKQQDINNIVTFAGETTDTMLDCKQMSDNLIYQITVAIDNILLFCSNYSTALVECNVLLNIATDVAKHKWMLTAQNTE